MHQLLRYLRLLFIGMYLPACSDAYVLEKVHVLDLDGEELEEVYVQIEAGKIASISETPFLFARKLDASGKYLMLPLWDMHVHLHGEREKFRGLLNHGVLGVRDLGNFAEGGIDSLRAWQEMQDQILPEIHFAGPIYNGANCEVDEHRSIGNLEELKAAISFQKEIGASLFKIHNCFPADLFDALLAECRKEGLKVVGHIPEGLDPMEFMQKGVASLEHTDILIRALSFRKNEPLNFTEAVALLDGPYLDSLAEKMRMNDIALDATLSTYEVFVKGLPEEQQALGMRVLEKLQSFTYRMHQAGVKVLTGTDLGLEGTQAGASLIRELELLVEAGFSEEEVLKASTVHAPESLGKERPEIKAGQAADLVLLNENPLDNISSLKKPYALLIKGKFHVVEEL